MHNIHSVVIKIQSWTHYILNETIAHVLMHNLNLTENEATKLIGFIMHKKYSVHINIT